jgi:hypothetical protein
LIIDIIIDAIYYHIITLLIILTDIADSHYLLRQLAGRQ